jgi:hypothetical protein
LSNFLVRQRLCDICLDDLTNSDEMRTRSTGTGVSWNKWPVNVTRHQRANLARDRGTIRERTERERAGGFAAATADGFSANMTVAQPCDPERVTVFDPVVPAAGWATSYDAPCVVSCRSVPAALVAVRSKSFTATNMTIVFASRVVIAVAVAVELLPLLLLGVPLRALVPDATPDHRSIAGQENSVVTQVNDPVAVPGSPAATSCSHASASGAVFDSLTSAHPVGGVTVLSVSISSQIIARSPTCAVAGIVSVKLVRVDDP